MNKIYFSFLSIFIFSFAHAKNDGYDAGWLDNGHLAIFKVKNGVLIRKECTIDGTVISKTELPMQNNGYIDGQELCETKKIFDTLEEQKPILYKDILWIKDNGHYRQATENEVKKITELCGYQKLLMWISQGCYYPMLVYSWPINIYASIYIDPDGIGANSPEAFQKELQPWVDEFMEDVKQVHIKKTRRQEVEGEEDVFWVKDGKHHYRQATEVELEEIDQIVGGQFFLCEYVYLELKGRHKALDKIGPYPDKEGIHEIVKMGREDGIIK